MDGTLNSLCTYFDALLSLRVCVCTHKSASNWKIRTHAYARQKRCLWHPNMENFLQKTQPFVIHFSLQLVRLSVYWKYSQTLLCRKWSNLFIGPKRRICKVLHSFLLFNFQKLLFDLYSDHYLISQIFHHQIFDYHHLLF